MQLLLYAATLQACNQPRQHLHQQAVRQLHQWYPEKKRLLLQEGSAQRLLLQMLLHRIQCRLQSRAVHVQLLLLLLDYSYECYCC
jgi:hypothetical protein